ncbi:NUDIX domain-containing protein [Paenibacillus sp. GYB003]|uniref:NUDIX domain-containing protein n=1 Tax=Paenibacillus sp. GYB003 TaxID=2994392 RepID=UPI002F96BA99
MTERLRTLDVEAWTANEPFCAGVVWVRDGKVAVTLNPDGIPAELGSDVLRIGGVGGGQEPGETIAECALREAKEELGSGNVRLRSSGETYFHDIDTGEISRIRCTDRTAPFLLQRQTSKTPDRPYKPGLPFGPYVYFGIYIGEADEARINPDDDVAGLLFVPIERWELLLRETVTVGAVLDAGADLLEAAPIPRQTRLWMPDNESMRTVVRLWKRRRP